MHELYPWCQSHWQSIMTAKSIERMPHAILLYGPKGIGKYTFTDHLVNNLLCDSPGENKLACGVCSSCVLFKANTHPDHLRVSIPDEKKVISIEQTREIYHHLMLKAKKSAFKTVTILAADKMTISAANSLLKILEEPPRNTVITLISTSLFALPVTIRSRCQKFQFSIHKREAEKWLAQQLLSINSKQEDINLMYLLNLVGGAPLRALSYLEQDLLSQRIKLAHNLFSFKENINPLKTVEDYILKIWEEALYWMILFTMDMIRIKRNVSTELLINTDIEDYLREFSRKVELKPLFSLLEKIEYSLWLLTNRTQINTQLLLEKLLIDWFLLLA
ncbi:DNA polymerase III subunit delta' [Candidatus Nitrosacidococcus tergens]|uniref:DNA polymerase III subunit delta' n=1 Tax=Candidatus Nitrosacidococcus tergens TaxID=553981 RepID=A0A7G1Q9M4_9GAMM|nr:DNA polymerase III subunit delta' [Candidatus Nitrosacidococcus tergens]CAB1275921.1 DNA-directed DNA polymerase [Candidatus Nitrosacidococcus tergens]